MQPVQFVPPAKIVPPVTLFGRFAYRSRMAWLLAQSATLPPGVRLGLLWTGVAAGLVMLPFIYIAIRRATLGGSAARRRDRDARSAAARTDAWSEAGRRFDSGAGGGRLDDTVDLDPFGPTPDGDRW